MARELDVVDILESIAVFSVTMLELLIGGVASGSNVGAVFLPSVELMVEFELVP